MLRRGADGGNTWSPMKKIAGVPGPKARNPAVQLSYDEGESWALKKPIEPDWSGYSDIAASSNGIIFLLYASLGLVKRGAQGGDAFRTEALTLARFNLEWLTNGKDPCRIG